MAAIELSALIDARPISWLQARTIFLCALVVMLDGYDIQAMALTVTAIANEWQVSPAGFSLALSASLIGIGIGSAFVAPLGDRWGRKPLILFSLLLLGISSCLTGFASSQFELVFWRFITGVGLGGSLTNTLALTTDLMPARKRSFLSILMISSIAVGAFFAGYFSPLVIQRYGWPGIFFIGGILPMVLLVVLYFGIPESVRFLYQKNKNQAGIIHILAKIAPGVDHREVFITPPQTRGRQSIALLLTTDCRLRTLLLWLIFSLNLFVMYGLISWLPSLLSSAGWSQTDALRGAAILQVGSVTGGLLMGVFLDRGKTMECLFTAYAVAAVAMAFFIVAPSTTLIWGLLIFLLGCGINGTQLTLYSLSASIYPSAFRATGLGWAVAISRIGAATGPLAIGWITTFGLGTGIILGALIIPTVFCAVTVLYFTRALNN
jgi:AAHS family 4-hydroxybenzoate transporter-like MFS transporter